MAVIKQLKDQSGTQQIFPKTTTQAVYNPDGSTLQATLNRMDSDLASIKATGTKNATGSTITSGTYFYLNGVLVRAKEDINNGSTFTSGTNYETVTAGALNELNGRLIKTMQYSFTTGQYGEASLPSALNGKTIVGVAPISSSISFSFTLLRYAVNGSLGLVCYRDVTGSLSVASSGSFTVLLMYMD